MVCNENLQLSWRSVILLGPPCEDFLAPGPHGPVIASARQTFATRMPLPGPAKSEGASATTVSFFSVQSALRLIH